MSGYDPDGSHRDSFGHAAPDDQRSHLAEHGYPLDALRPLTRDELTELHDASHAEHDGGDGGAAVPG